MSEHTDKIAEQMAKAFEQARTPLLNLGTTAARNGVSTSTFRVSRDEAEQIRRAERDGGK